MTGRRTCRTPEAGRGRSASVSWRFLGRSDGAFFSTCAEGMTVIRLRKSAEILLQRERGHTNSNGMCSIAVAYINLARKKRPVRDEKMRRTCMRCVRGVWGTACHDARREVADPASKQTTPSATSAETGWRANEKSRRPRREEFPHASRRPARGSCESARNFSVQPGCGARRRQRAASRDE